MERLKFTRDLVVLSGANSYVGSNLINRLLKNKSDVITLRRSNQNEFDFENSKYISSQNNKSYHYNLNKLASHDFHNTRVVFVHLATKGPVTDDLNQVSSFLQANAELGLSLVNFMLKYNFKQFIFAESYWQFAVNGSIGGHNAYAISKSCFSLIVEMFSQRKSINAVALVLYDVFGEEDPRPKLLNTLKSSAKTGEMVSIIAGHQIVDFVHIDDVVSAFVLCISETIEDPRNTNFQRYVVRGLKPMSVREYVGLIEKSTGLAFNIEWNSQHKKQVISQDPWLPSDDFLLPLWRPEVSFEKRIRRFFKS